ncbi:hypothetical protein ACHAQH_005254 [Verticillium albo-atrum]
MSFDTDEPHRSPLSSQRTKEQVQRPLRVDMMLPHVSQQQPVAKASQANKDDIKAYVEWESLVAEYTTRTLTNKSDRIPAILGLANRMGPMFQCEFVDGTWRGKYFLRSLLWRVKNPSTSTSPLPSNALYPSWTWASRHGTAIDYHLVQVSSEHAISWPTSLIPMDVTLKGQTENSATGSITLLGPFGKMTPEETRQLQREATGSRRLRSHLDSDYHFDVTPERPGPDSAKSASTLWCFWYLDMMKFGHGEKYHDYGSPTWPGSRPGWTVMLFLEAVDSQDSPRVFRRIGIGSIRWNTQDVTVREVTIV